MAKKFKVREVEGIEYALVDSLEEQQGAQKQGYKNIMWGLKKEPKRKGKRGRLSGRCRYDRYSGIFQNR